MLTYLNQSDYSINIHFSAVKIRGNLVRFVSQLGLVDFVIVIPELTEQ